MKTMLSDPFFWAGQIGLVLIVVCSLIIIEIIRPYSKWYFVVALYLTQVAALGVLVHPAVESMMLPAPTYLFRLMVGASFLTACFQIRSNKGMVISPATGLTMRRIAFFGGGGGMATMLLVALLIRLSEQKQAAQLAADQEEQNHVEQMKAIAADTTIKAELRNGIDTVKKQLIKANRETDKARVERDKLLKRTRLIKDDTEAIRNQSPRKTTKPPVETQKEEPKKGFFNRLFGGRNTSRFDSVGTVAPH